MSIKEIKEEFRIKDDLRKFMQSKSGKRITRFGMFVLYKSYICFWGATKKPQSDKGKLVNWNGKKVNKLKRNSVVLARDNKRKWTQSVLLNKQQKVYIKWVDHFNILFKHNKRRVWNVVIVLI